VIHTILDHLDDRGKQSISWNARSPDLSVSTDEHDEWRAQTGTEPPLTGHTGRD